MSKIERRKGKKPPKGTYTLTEQANELLQLTPKERERTGDAVYKVAGQFFKQGGSYKSWKDRWFVIDDTAVTYYKEKKDWESGPVLGKPFPPQGSIPFHDIISFSRCDSQICAFVSEVDRPAKGTLCLHIHTLDRIYHVLGFVDKAQLDKWQTMLEFARKSYNLQREAKKWLRAHVELKLKDESIQRTRLFRSHSIDKDLKIGEGLTKKRPSSTELVLQDQGELRSDSERESIEMQLKTAAPKAEKVLGISGGSQIHTDRRKGDSFRKSINPELAKSDDEGEAPPKPRMHSMRFNKAEESSPVPKRKDTALSQQGLKTKLQSMKDDDIKELLSIFLKEYEKESQLKDVLLTFLYKEKSFPVFFLNSLSDEDFQKFKPMQKLNNICNKHGW